MRKRIINGLISSFLLLVLSAMTQAVTYHVSPGGDDAGPGTAGRPWRTLPHAAGSVRAGDRVLLHDGTYSLSGPLTLSQSGTAGAWIVFAAAPGGHPILDASAWRPANEGEASWRGALELTGPAYVRLQGLRVRNSYGYGIIVRGPSHHVDIQDCTVERTFACGIGAWNAAWLRVVGCEVTHANTQAMRLYGDPRQECPHEAISIAGVKHFEAAWNHVHDCDKEGIDVKEVSAHGVVHHNWVHDMPRQGLYTDAWFGTLEDVEWYSNAVTRCEWGLVISAEGKGAEMHNVRAHHNVLWQNRGSGLYFGTWGADGPRVDIRLDHNTLFGNGRPAHWAGPTGNIDVRSHGVRNLTVADNLCAGGGAYEIATFIDPATESDRFAALGISVTGNLVASQTSDTRAPATYGKVYAWPGRNAVVADPRLSDPKHGDFTPRTASPALRGRNRYIGAFGPGAKRLPPPQATLTGFPVYHPAPRGDWPVFLSP